MQTPTVPAVTLADSMIADLIVLRLAMETAAQAHAKAHREAIRTGGLPPAIEFKAAIAARRAYFASVDAHSV